MDMKQDFLLKLAKAQELLSEVYHYAADNQLFDIERSLSCADTCINEAVEAVEQLKTFRVLAKMTTNYYMDVIAPNANDALHNAKGVDISMYNDKEMVDFYVEDAYLRS